MPTGRLIVRRDAPAQAKEKRKKVSGFVISRVVNLDGRIFCSALVRLAVGYSLDYFQSKP
jgi:hypothetical protein